MGNQIVISEEVRELINEVARATATAAYMDHDGGTINYFRAMEMLLFNYKKLAMLVVDYDLYIAGHTSARPQRSKSVIMRTPDGNPPDASDTEEIELQRNYSKTRTRFEELDRVVKLFKDRKEFNVVRMYYFNEDAEGNDRGGAEAWTWEGIADALSSMGMVRDAKSARRWRSRIVNDMAVCMFGKPAAIGTSTYRRELDKSRGIDRQ